MGAILSNRVLACLAGASVVAAAVYSGAATAADFRCPQTIVSYQQLAEPVSGWTEFSRDPWGTAGDPHADRLQNKSGFSRIEVYDGNPKELADLVPDNERDTWSFDASASAGRPTFMACVYDNTDVRLVKQLSPDIVKCRASKKGVLSCEERSH